MSIAVGDGRPGATGDPGRGGRRRVRHEARDALAVVAFSAGASVALALAMTLLLSLVG